VAVMKCELVQQLLPLFVADDLDETGTSRVAAHLQICTPCGDLADEYRETRRMVTLFAPPPFNEAVYAGVRTRVLREIAREAAQPTLAQSLRSKVWPHLRWAVAAALAIAVSLFAIHLNTGRVNDRKLAEAPRTGDPVIAEKQRDITSAGSSASYPEQGGHLPSAGTQTIPAAEAKIAETIRPDDQTRHRTSTDAPAAPIREAAQPPDVPMNAHAMFEGGSPDEPNTARTLNSEKLLRVEMQTKDPNIRIIWFSHQRIRQESRDDTSPGSRS